MSDYDLTYLSWGAGTQSTAMLVMSALGLHGVPRATVAVFSDTGDEPASVYDTLRFYKGWAEGHGIEVVVASAGTLSTDALAHTKGDRENYFGLPVFVHGSDGRPSMLRRKCTRDYKIDPLERAVRTHLGYAKGERVKDRVRCLIGISSDEVVRMKPNPRPWITNDWPLVDARLSRDDCIGFLERRGLPAATKSSCVQCPFHSDYHWGQMKAEDPESFARAVAFDAAIRDQEVAGVRSQVFLHRSLKPLGAVDFETWRDGTRSMFGGMNQECEGMCGV